MAKFCTKCGAPTTEGVKFCPKCGAAIGQTQAAPQPTAPPQQPPVQQQQSIPQQQQPAYQPQQPQQPYYGQTQPYAPMPGKSNKKMIIGVVVAVVAIVVVLLLVFFVLGGDEGKFVGTWEIESMETISNGVSSGSIPGDGTKIEFKSDGTTKTTNPDGSTNSGKWELKNGKLCNPDISSESENVFGKECVDYKFSNGDKTLTITYSMTQEYYGTTYTMKSNIVLKKV